MIIYIIVSSSFYTAKLCPFLSRAAFIQILGSLLRDQCVQSVSAGMRSLIGWELQMRATLIALPCKASTATLTAQTSLVDTGMKGLLMAHTSSMAAISAASPRRA